MFTITFSIFFAELSNAIYSIGIDSRIAFFQSEFRPSIGAELWVFDRWCYILSLVSYSSSDFVWLLFVRYQLSLSSAIKCIHPSNYLNHFCSMSIHFLQFFQSTDTVGYQLEGHVIKISIELSNAIKAIDSMFRRWPVSNVRLKKRCIHCTAFSML